jgi:hypothetical protein
MLNLVSVNNFMLFTWRYSKCCIGATIQTFVIVWFTPPIIVKFECLQFFTDACGIISVTLKWHRIFLEWSKRDHVIV